MKTRGAPPGARYLAVLLDPLAAAGIRAARSEVLALAEGLIRTEIEEHAWPVIQAAHKLECAEEISRSLLPAEERTLASAWTWAEIRRHMDDTGQATYRTPESSRQQGRSPGTPPAPLDQALPTGSQHTAEALALAEGKARTEIETLARPAFEAADDIRHGNGPLTAEERAGALARACAWGAILDLMEHTGQATFHVLAPEAHPAPPTPGQARPGLASGW